LLAQFGVSTYANVPVRQSIGGVALQSGETAGREREALEADGGFETRSAGVGHKKMHGPPMALNNDVRKSIPFVASSEKSNLYRSVLTPISLSEVVVALYYL
jgi:hypothetical protein